MNRRKILWSHLVNHPGLTAYELTRAALGKGAGDARGGSVRQLLVKMEADEQVYRQITTREGQGRLVSEWFAMPGAFATEEAQS